MAEERAKRRLAAILAADVVGFARMMGEDEAGTLAALKARRKELLQPLVAEHQGRIVKLMGDGVLIEFGSAVDAVDCAIRLQEGMEAANAGLADNKRIVLRIGVNLGDVMVEGADLYGDGVNIAARLEAMADPGSILVSRTVANHVRGKVKVGFEDLGGRQLKNIAEPVQVFRLRLEAGADVGGPALTLPDKPSIAVLPFQNMSGDPAQEYFADGIVDDIITELSRLRWLFVIARNSSFAYKGRAVDIKQVGRELGVRYVLEGSVRRSGDKVRITGQLVDTSTGAHIWADRFDGTFADIFDLQDQVTTSVVAAIAPKLEQAEIERAKRKPTESLDAYDYYLRGLASLHRWTREGNEEALRMFYRAIELDPEFASAYGMASRCYSQRKTAGWMVDPRSKEVAEAERLARLAAELGRDDAVALWTAGLALGFVVGDLDEAATLTDRALALNPNLAWAWLFSGWVNVWIGESEVALERFARAMRMSPQDPLYFQMQAGTALAHFFAGRYVEAAKWAEMATREQRSFLLVLCTAAASNAFAGRAVEAGRAMARLRQVDPQLCLSNLGDLLTLRRPEDIAKWKEGLERAGLPK
jgi:TolB-like protein/Tfp pilus assembly protein PilF